MFDLFEYGVILKGSQTNFTNFWKLTGFEYGVILKGSQTQGACGQ